MTTSTTRTSIQAAQYNSIQARISKLLGKGTGDYGYGQTVVSREILPGTRISAQPLINAKTDIDKISFHQRNQASTVPTVALGQTIANTDWTAYTNELSNLEANRLKISETAQQSLWTQDYATLSFSNWNSLRSHTVTFDFQTLDDARYFFNTGGEIRIVPRHTGFANAASKGAAWAALFNRLGTKGIRIQANTTICEVGQSETKGYYQLTTNPQQIFMIEDTGPYAGNDLTVLASVSNPLRQLIITVRYNDDTSIPSSDEAVDGTTISSIGVLRAVGASVAIRADPVAITNLSVPGAPTNVSAIATGGTTATINYVAPINDGGSIITSYTAVSIPDNIITTVNRSTSGQIFVTGLRPVTDYTFVVYASNSVGPSSNSTPSQSIRTTQDVPTKPLDVVAFATGSTTATVQYSEPISNGGSTIISYTAISTPGNIQATVTRTGGGSITVTGLSIATTYSFKVFATNSIGNSALSDASVDITTATVEPQLGAAYGGGYFAGAISTQGNDVADYFLIVSPATLGESPTLLTWSNVQETTSSTSLVDGQTNSNSLPTVPTAPIIGLPSIVPLSGGTQVDIPFTQPVNNGGSAITSYTAISTPDNITSTIGRATSGIIRVSNLTPNISYSFKMYATNAVGNSPLSLSTAEVQNPILPTNTVAPLITGTVVLGSTLTLEQGTWTGTPPITYSYQWQRGTTNIAGATEIIYVITASDISNTLRCVVTATNVAGSRSATSVSTITVPAVSPVNTALPTISGTVRVGETLQTSTGTWTGVGSITYTYQWERGTTPIAGQTTNRYTLVLTDVGNRFRCKVTATNSAGPTSIYTAGTAIVPSVSPTNTDLPLITGTITVGFKITCSPGTWTGTPTIQFTYQWLRNSSPISGATTNSYTILQSDVGSVLACEVKGTNNAGNLTVTSLPTPTIQAASAPVNNTTPTISGTAVVGEILTVNTGDWSGTPPITYRYQWLRGTNTITGATNNTYTVVIADTLTTVSCRVTATNVTGTSTATSLPTGIIPAVVPNNAIIPAISGVVEIGKSIAVTTGTWTGTPPITYTYQWQRANTDIDGATSNTYTVQLADSGNQLRCKVTATNSAGSSNPVSSLSTITVPLPSLPNNSSAPTITGTVSVDNQLTSSTGTWTGTGPFTYTYQWIRGAEESIIGANFNKYTVTIDDVGSTLKVKVRATNASGFREAISNNTIIVPRTAPINKTRPEISGSIQIGELLSATTGDWIGSPPITYQYQWYRGNVNNAINGATNSTYRVVLSDANNALYVRVTARNDVASRSQTSLATAIVPSATAPVNSIAPNITGTAAIGETLTINTGTWTGTTPITYAYQWQRGTTSIPGATSTVYVVVGDDTGNTIRCRVQATNSGGGPISAFSAATPTIPASAPINKVIPTITGTLAIGQNLTVGTGNWIGSNPISYSYQWEKNNAAISGATSNVYVVRVADNNSSLRCGVTATNNVGSVKVYTSPTAVISAVAPANTSLPTILGILNVGQTIQVNTGTWSGTQPITFTYQWKRGTSNIFNATSQTYVIQISDLGQSLTCQITATNVIGSTQASSSPTGIIQG